MTVPTTFSMEYQCVKCGVNVLVRTCGEKFRFVPVDESVTLMDFNQVGTVYKAIFI